MTFNFLNYCYVKIRIYKQIIFKTLFWFLMQKRGVFKEKKKHNIGRN